jgi:ZIP family zinc transporter
VAAELTAAGGGILLAAVALELVPEADDGARAWLTAGGLLAGTLAYVGAGAWPQPRHAHDDDASRRPCGRRRAAHADAARLARRGARGGDRRRDLRRRRPRVRGPGAYDRGGELGVALLAGILLGNLVESYGAAQPIIAEGRSRRFAVGLLGAIGVSLAVATALGATLLADASAALVGTAEAFAAGAVLAVVSIAIIPCAFSAVSSRVAAATVLGFIAGYLLS